MAPLKTGELRRKLKAAISREPTLHRAELARRFGVTPTHIARLIQKQGLSVPRLKGGRPRKRAVA